MSLSDATETFIRFYQLHYDDDIAALCENYPDKCRSLYIDWETLNTYDAGLADDFLKHPAQTRMDAEEALRLYDTPGNDSLGQAHVRITNHPQSHSISALTSHHAQQLVAVTGYVQECSHVQPKIQQAAFECQRCGSLTRIPQSGDELRSPAECMGCERNGPFRLHNGQSEFVDWQTGTLREMPSSAADSPQALSVSLEDDLAGALTASTHVTVTGVLQLTSNDTSDVTFEMHLAAQSVPELEKEIWEQWATDYLGVTVESSTLSQTALEEFVQRSRHIITTTDGLNESNTQAKILTPFLHVLGWNVFGPDVQLEYSGSDEEVGGSADYALLDRDGRPVVIVEAKRVARSLDPHLGQLKEYMRVFGADWGVLSNGDRYLMLRADEDSSSPHEHQVLDCRLEELCHHQKTLTAISNEQF